MERYVISMPRSGLNWLRYCVEHMYGVRTPGKTLILDREGSQTPAFARSHDPLHAIQRSKTGAWLTINPKIIHDRKVVLILRDPLESFVRASGQKLERFKNYSGNIRFYSEAESNEKAVFFYEDLISDPVTMWNAMEFLGIEPAAGYLSPTLEQLRREWEEISQKSRATYDVNQAESGGAMTKDSPTDYKFHQRSMTSTEKQAIWEFLMSELCEEEMNLLQRYR